MSWKKVVTSDDIAYVKQWGQRVELQQGREEKRKDRVRSGSMWEGADVQFREAELTWETRSGEIQVDSDGDGSLDQFIKVEAALAPYSNLGDGGVCITCYTTFQVTADFLQPNQSAKKTIFSTRGSLGFHEDQSDHVAAGYEVLVGRFLEGKGKGDQIAIVLNSNWKKSVEVYEWVND